MRTRSKVGAFVALAVVLCAGRAQAQVVPPETTRVELGAMFWNPAPELSLTFGGSGDTSIDFVNDLGIEKERVTEYRVTVKPGRKHKLRFSYDSIEYEQEGHVLNRTVRVNGRPYPVNGAVSSALKWDLYRFGYEWDAVALNKGFVGVIFDVKYNKVSASLAGAGITESTEVKAPVPTIGGIARGYIGDFVSITGEFTALKLDRDDFRGKFYDFDLYAQINLVKSLAAQLGYRSVTVDYLVDSDAGLFTLRGPYVGGVVRF